MKLNPLVAAAGLVLMGIGSALAEAPDYQLSDYKLGKIVAGDKLDLKNLDGRVVAIEYWGPR